MQHHHPWCSLCADTRSLKIFAALEYARNAASDYVSLRTLSDGAAVKGAGGRPALADAVEAAVAQAAAGRAHPSALGLHLQDVLPVAHEQAVPAEHPLRDMLLLLSTTNNTGSTTVSPKTCHVDPAPFASGMQC